MNTVDHNAMPQPWYRERWPWLLMAGPAAVIVAGFFTLWLAVKSDDGLVADDYYKRGLAINQTLSRGQAARDLGLSAEVELDPQAGRVRVQLRGTGQPERLSLRLVHPTRAVSDQRFELQRTGAGEYVGVLTEPPGGRRVVLLEDPARQWRLAGEAAAGQNTLTVTPQ